jgi:hypothetical protein
VADQVGHAMRERVGLAGTGPRDHQQRPESCASSPVPCRTAAS